MPAIVEANITKFGKSELSLLQLAAQAARPIVSQHRDRIERVIVANSYSAELNGISGVHLKVAKAIGLDHIPSERSDNISGSGGMALVQAERIIKSGEAKTVLIVGAEKMTHMPTKELTRIISTLLFEEESATGLTLPSLAGLMANACIANHMVSRQDIAEVAVQNRYNGSLNPNAHLYEKGAVTYQQVVDSKVIADPLRLYEYCPNSDGAAALLVTANDIAHTFTSKPVFIRGTGMGADSALIASRSTFTRMPSVEIAARIAYDKAGIRPTHIDAVEVHDMAAVLQPVQLKALNIFADDRYAWKGATLGVTSLRGGVPVNPSGGLISCGHPIAVSGLKQAVEGFLQIREEAGLRQVKTYPVDNFVMVSLGGFANSAIVLVLGRDGKEREPRNHNTHMSFSINGSRPNVINGNGVVLTTTLLNATAEGFPDSVRLAVVELPSGHRIVARGEPEQKVTIGEVVKLEEGIDDVVRIRRD